MNLRLLAAADAESFWHLRLEALRNDSASFADSAEEHQNTTVETVRERLSSRDPATNFVLGMFQDGKLIATAGFYRSHHNKERHKGNIWGVYVRPESRGKGVAKALMQEIIHRARNITGLEQVLLIASAHLPARKLYESLGFQAYGVEPRSLKITTETGTEYVDDVLMILRL
ncbi:MAG TPA: GNAT family N-acetyltransferase [Verrucomicrobiae bacterium]|nr:GNAT family N-acetyltransferase [Verrucomicrobiae bacterium]